MTQPPAIPRRAFLAVTLAAVPPGNLAGQTPMPHIVLLGDSIFDNAAYVAGGPDVRTQLQERLPTGWRATLLAVDGAVIADIPRQLDRLPSDASWLVLSIGGNDALRHAYLLEQPARSVAEAVGRLAEVRDAFASSYAKMVEAVLARGLPTAACTIYDGRFPDPRGQRLRTTALAVLNDAITRTAFAHGLPLLDLRLICSDDADYANPIEPSVRGGAKIANAIAALVTGGAGGRPRSMVIAG